MRRDENKKNKDDIKDTKKAADEKVLDTDLDIDNEDEDEEITIVDTDIEKDGSAAKTVKKKALPAKKETTTELDNDDMDIVIPIEKKQYELTRKYYLYSLAIMIVAALVFVLFGPAVTVENTGGKAYTATVKNYFPENRIDELEQEISDVAGFDVNVKLDTSLLSGTQIIEIRVKSGQRISQYLVAERLNEKFPYMEIGNFAVSEYSPMLTIDNLITYSVVLGLALIALYIIASILLNGKNGIKVVFTALHDVLLVISLYIICRVPNPRLLIMGALVALVASPYFNITKIAEFEKSASGKKRKAIDAVTDILAYEKDRNVNLIITVSIMCVALAGVGIAVASDLIVWFGGTFAAAFGVTMYSTTAVVPNMWGLANQPKIKKTKTHKNKKKDAKSKKSDAKPEKNDSKSKGKNERKDKK